VKAPILFAVFILAAMAAHCQMKFESGYYINNEGQRVECLIRNMEWKNTYPKSFEFRLEEASASAEVQIEGAREFGIGSTIYRRFTVNMDRSSDRTERLTENRNPEFTNETLFLKVLLVGKASLFQYEESGLLRFFYSLDQSPVQQLIYKRFIVKENAARNDTYKQQLLNELKCETVSSKEVEGLNYSSTDLMKFFVKYNQCQGASVATAAKAVKRDAFNLTIRPGVSFSSLILKNAAPNVFWGPSMEFASKPTFRLGVEFEFFGPFNKGNWSAFIEPTFQSYSSEAASGATTAKVDYRSIEIPVGIRHYIFLADRSTIFINGGLVLDYPFSSSTVDYAIHNDLAISGESGLFAGAGYKRNRYSAEFRAAFGRGVVPLYRDFTSKYNQFMLVLGYTLF